MLAGVAALNNQVLVSLFPDFNPPIAPLSVG